MARAAAARRSSLAWPAGRRSRCACRPAAPSRAAYCIIPTTRGRPRSVPVDDVLREVERVTAAGFKEIALTGVHLGSYGRDLDAGVVAGRAAARARRLGRRATSGDSRPFCSASARSSRWTARPRSSSSSPTHACFAPHFHLPLQHASNRMLARDAPALHDRAVLRRSSTTSARASRTPPSAPTSSSASLARPTTTSTQLADVPRSARR